MIICNDGSTDGSEKIISNFNDPRIKIINKSNAGTVSALNVCLANSTGENILWLSSDDIYAPEKLAQHYNFIKSINTKNISILGHGTLTGDSYLASDQIVPDKKYLINQFIFGNYINGLSICVPKEFYLNYGLFDSRYIFAHDVERWIQLFRFNTPFFLDTAPLSFSRIGSSNSLLPDYMGIIDVLKILYVNFKKFGFLFFQREKNNSLLETINILLFFYNKESLVSRLNAWSLFRPLIRNTLQNEGALIIATNELLKISSNSSDILHEQILLLLSDKSEDEVDNFPQYIFSICNDININNELRKIYLNYLKTGF